MVEVVESSTAKSAVKLEFRGRCLDSGEYAYGWYYFDGKKHWILKPHPEGKFCHADEVDPESVQYRTPLDS